MEEEDEKEKGEHQTAAIVEIGEPLFFWILVLVVALIARVVATSGSVFAQGSSAASLINASANFILFQAGSLILPLVIGAVIGSEIGKEAKNLKKSLKAGLINGAYASIIYMIAIVIIYEVFIAVIPAALIPQAVQGPLGLVISLIIPQIAILIVVIEVFASLSHFRKINL